MPSQILTIIANAYQVILLLAGLGLLWYFVLRSAVRKKNRPVALARWDAPLGDFFLFLWLILSGGFILYVCVFPVQKYFFSSDDAKAAVGTAAIQMGWVAGYAIYHLVFRCERPVAGEKTREFFVPGLVTFLIAIPVVTAVALVWGPLLELCGLPAEKQDLIRMFVDAKNQVLLCIMIFLACIGAPLAEELVFRAGIFRYARTRLPRWGALLLPACVFGAAHNNLTSYAPLVTLGIIFSLAYERTGDIRTTMVAHALFNLNSIVLIFIGPKG